MTASGGTSPYSYLWSSGGTNATANNLSAGFNVVNITDAHGCIIPNTISITTPSEVISVISQNGVNCFGESNGSATVSVSGGTPGYSYSWSSGGTNATESGLIAGSYTCTITDANGCQNTENITVTQPTPLASGISQNGVSCFGESNGSATVTPLEELQDIVICGHLPEELMRLLIIYLQDHIHAQ